MVYNKEQIFEAAKAKIMELEIDRVSNVLSYLPITAKMFYTSLPIGSKPHKKLTKLTKRYAKPVN